MNNPSMVNAVALLARLLLAYIFLSSGIGKISAFGGVQQYMNSVGVPGALLPVVIALEIVLSLMLIVGFQTRWAALGLAAFTLIAGVLFHYQPSDMNQMIHFSKNLAIAGGLFALVTGGPGAWSVDARLRA